jgi:hypothetical protein
MYLLSSESEAVIRSNVVRAPGSAAVTHVRELYALIRTNFSPFTAESPVHRLP